jgi:predicted membrane-bound spermidine synthase
MTKKLRTWAMFLIFLNGFASMALELLVMRQLSFFVGSSAVITSIIIGSFLGFMSWGYFRGERKKISKNKTRRMLAANFLVIAIIGVLAASFTLITAYFHLMYSIGIYSIIIQTFIFSAVFLSAGPFLFGFNTSLLSRLLSRANSHCTGSIMGWDTIGSVLGSLATTLLLMPFIGVNHTIILITVLAIAGALINIPRLGILLAGILVLVPTYYINSDNYLLREHGIIVNNANSTISVVDNGNFRALYMNGVSMSFFNPHDRRSAEYVDYINNAFIKTMPRDRRREILVLGAGGFTVGLDDSFNNYTFIDIEKTLRDVSEQKFLGEKLTPNKKFIVADAGQFLKNTDKKYDLIVLDVYSNSYQVPEDFITMEFMQRLKSRIAPNGVVLMNVICTTNFSDKFTRVFDNTFHAVFRNNTSRQVVGYENPWADGSSGNVMYIYYNRGDDDRVYTINKTPVIYDRK